MSPDDINQFVHHLLGLAARSPCARDKRGALVVCNGEVLGEGFNAPVSGACSDAVCRKTEIEIRRARIRWCFDERIEHPISCGGYVEHAEGMAMRLAVIEAISRDSLADRDTFNDNRAAGEYLPLTGCDLAHLNTTYCGPLGWVAKPSRRGKACPTCAVQALDHGVAGIWLYHATDEGYEWVRYEMTEYGRMAGVL